MRRMNEYETKIYNEANEKLQKVYDGLYDLMVLYEKYGNLPRIEKRYGKDITICFSLRFENEEKTREFELYGDITKNVVDIKTSSGPNVCDKRFIHVLNEIYKLVEKYLGGN